MIVTLDGRRLEGTFQPDPTLRDLVDQVRAGHADDRLIISVKIDGQILGDSELAARLEEVVAADAQVDLESCERASLVRDALRGLALEFQQILGRSDAIADRMNSDDATQALRDVGAIVGTWQTCYRALDQCGDLLGISLTESVVDGRPLHEHLSELVHVLTAVRQALETRDLVVLTDLVRYELPPLAKAWQRLMEELAEQVASNASAI